LATRYELENRLLTVATHPSLMWHIKVIYMYMYMAQHINTLDHEAEKSENYGTIRKPYP